MAQRIEPRAKRVPTPDDEFLAWATRQAALSMGEWLVGAELLEKKVRHLSITDMERMAQHAIDRWIILRSEREAHERDNPEEPPDILLGM